MCRDIPAIQDVLDVCPYITDEENEEKEWEKGDERVSLSAIVQQAIKHSALVAANLGGATPSTAKKAGSVSLPDESQGTTDWHRDHERVCSNHHRAKENRAKENSPPPTEIKISPSPADSMLTIRQLEFPHAKSQKSHMCAAEKAQAF